MIDLFSIVSVTIIFTLALPNLQVSPIGAKEAALFLFKKPRAHFFFFKNKKHIKKFLGGLA